MRGNGIRYGIRFLALGYLGALLIAPLALIFKDTFKDGLTPVWNQLSDVDTVHAAKLTLYAMIIAVVANTIFGVAIALYLARRKGPLATILGAFIDLPLALSPVVVGLALLLVFANTGWFGTVVHRQRLPGRVRVPVDRDRDRLRLAAVRRARADTGAARDRRGAAAGGRDARRDAACRRSGASRCRRSARR